MSAAKKLVSRAEFATLVGINPATVGELCTKGPLRNAAEGTRVNITHPRVIEYIDRKAKARTDDPIYDAFLAAWKAAGDDATVQNIATLFQIGKKRANELYHAMISQGDYQPILKDKPIPGTLGALEKRKQESLKEIPSDLSELMSWTIGEILDRWGTTTAFLDWLRATKTLEDIREKQLKNAEKSGVLISRDIVKKGVIDPIDAAHIKLLTDGVKTIAKRAMAMTSANRPPDDVEKFVGDQIGSFLRPLKNKIARALKHA